jgi:hypothetical protein
VLIEIPFVFGKIIAGYRFRIIFLDGLKILRFLHQMAKIIDDLSDMIPAIAVIGRNFGHGKICLGEDNSPGINADNYLRDLLYTQLVG